MLTKIWEVREQPPQLKYRGELLEEKKKIQELNYDKKILENYFKGLKEITPYLKLELFWENIFK